MKVWKKSNKTIYNIFMKQIENRIRWCVEYKSRNSIFIFCIIMPFETFGLKFCLLYNLKAVKLLVWILSPL